LTHDDAVAGLSRYLAAPDSRATVRGLCAEATQNPREVDLRTRCADLVLIGREPCWRNARLRRHIIDSLLFDAATPVLLPPTRWHATSVTRAMLGWNETIEALRAARVLVALIEPPARLQLGRELING
jgi:hypothetical protein